MSLFQVRSFCMPGYERERDQYVEAKYIPLEFDFLGHIVDQLVLPILRELVSESDLYLSAYHGFLKSSPLSI